MPPCPSLGLLKELSCTRAQTMCVGFTHILLLHLHSSAQRKVWGPVLTGGKIRLRKFSISPYITHLVSKHQIPHSVSDLQEHLSTLWMRGMDAGRSPRVT